MAENTLPAGSTNIQGLAPWAAPYITGYLGQAQALGQMPYNVYQGPLTAGVAPLQQSAFQGIANLTVPQAMLQSTDFLSQIAQNLGNFQYQPIGTSFTGRPIPTRFNMPLQVVQPTQLQQGNLGQPIGAGQYQPWGGFRQRVEYVAPTPAPGSSPTPAPSISTVLPPPPVVQPPVTQPPVTQPPVTQPPVTQPPAVQPGANNYYGVTKPAYTNDSQLNQDLQQAFQKTVAEKAVPAPVVAQTRDASTRSDKADQVLSIYNQIGRYGELQPSAAEVAFWASQNKPIEQIRQDLLQSAATFKNDPVYGNVGQLANRILNEGLTSQVRLDLPDQGQNLLRRGGAVGYADGGSVGMTQQDFAAEPTAGMTGQMGGIASLPYSGYQTPTATGSADFLGSTPYEIPQPSQQVSGIAAQYMNPYLQAALQPQLEETRRQAQINLQPSLAKLTQAGGLGGGRQAIMESEAQRNLLQAQRDLLGKGYQSAYDVAQQQFNTEQQRAIQEAQFGANLGLQAAQQQAQAAQAMGQLGMSQNQAQLQNLQQALTAGQTQRDIEQQGITADYNEYLKQVQYPYQQVQFMRDMLTGLPVSTVQNQQAQLSGAAALIGALGGIGNLSNSLANPNLQNLLSNLGLGGLFSQNP